jgi:phage-related protein
MSEFPRLKTGAVAQYPAEKSVVYSTTVLRFLDGTEQRCRDYGTALRRWTIRLDRLDEREMAQVEEFFLSQQGQAEDFTFTDPWDGEEYPACSIENHELVLSFLEQGRGQTLLVIRENRR